MKILLVQPSLDPPGGGNLVAAWMLQALRDDHALSLLTWQRPRLAACNRHYGTALREDDFDVYCVAPLARRLGRLSPLPLGLLKDAYLMRRARELIAAHDLVIGCNNEVDFGCRGIQYVHYPKLSTDRPAVDLHWYHASRTIIALYYRFAARLARFSMERMRANLTLVNSAYMATRVRALHGIDPVVLYPPVAAECSPVPWTERENGFVCVGRLSPEKRVDIIIDILRRVRAAGDEVDLHIVGVPDDRRHMRLLLELAGRHGEWIHLHTDLSRPALLQLMQRQRYGIHAMLDEPFGIAVAEMLRAGNVVFVPRSGGPAEIVGEQAELCWSTPDDAVVKIQRVLRDPVLQAALGRHLAARATLFSCGRFCSELRALVTAFRDGTR